MKCICVSNLIHTAIDNPSPQSSKKFQSLSVFPESQREFHYLLSHV